MRAIGMFGSSAFAALCTLGLVACGGSTSAPSSSTSIAQSSLARDMAPTVAPSDSAALSVSNTKFAADLYKVAGQAHAADNFFFSPYSISVALSMAYAGAKGSTATQMASAAHFDLAPEKLFPAFDALDLTLASRSKPATSDGQGLDLHVVNSNWGEQTLAFQKPYLDTLAVSYGAGVRLTDFIHAPDAARMNINGWVSDQTNAKIVDLLPEGSLTSDTRFVLVNAVYFKAVWQTPFEPSATRPADFHKLDGSTASVDEMSTGGDFAYAASDNYEAVELPYLGGTTSMVVVLPREGKFASVDAALSGDMIQSTFTSLQAYSPVHVSLPKFTIKGATISIKDSLTSLGMKDAFDSSKADFTGIGDGGLFIGDVLHQAFIAVDEKGTEAAAATAVIGVGGSAAPTKVTEFNVNRPFLVFIRDIPTNTAIFAGRVTTPG